MSEGKKDKQTVDARGIRAATLNIGDVKIVELHNVISRSGWLTEIFRSDWKDLNVTPQHIIFSQMNVGGVTDWHRHAKQTDHLVALTGNIKLVLWDGREDSPSYAASDVIRMGAVRPVMVVVPAGVWHGLRNESGTQAAYINITEFPYRYSDPDDYRLSKREDIPVDL